MENEEIFLYASFKKKQFPLEAIACNLLQIRFLKGKAEP